MPNATCTRPPLPIAMSQEGILQTRRLRPPTNDRNRPAKFQTAIGRAGVSRPLGSIVEQVNCARFVGSGPTGLPHRGPGSRPRRHVVAGSHCRRPEDYRAQQRNCPPALLDRHGRCTLSSRLTGKVRRGRSLDSSIGVRHVAIDSSGSHTGRIDRLAHSRLRTKSEDGREIRQRAFGLRIEAEPSVPFGTASSRLRGIGVIPTSLRCGESVRAILVTGVTQEADQPSPIAGPRRRSVSAESSGHALARPRIVESIESRPDDEWFLDANHFF